MSEKGQYISSNGYSYQELHSQVTERLKVMKRLKDPNQIRHIPINHEKYKDEKVGALWRNKKTGKWYPKYDRNSRNNERRCEKYLLIHAAGYSL